MCVVDSHIEACTNEALDEGVRLALVPTCNGTEYGESTVDDTGRSGAYLAHSQSNALTAQQLDDRRRKSGELYHQRCGDLKRKREELVVNHGVLDFSTIRLNRCLLDGLPLDWSLCKSR